LFLENIIIFNVIFIINKVINEIASNHILILLIVLFNLKKEIVIKFREFKIMRDNLDNLYAKDTSRND